MSACCHRRLRSTIILPSGRRIMAGGGECPLACNRPSLVENSRSALAMTVSSCSTTGASRKSAACPGEHSRFAGVVVMNVTGFKRFLGAVGILTRVEVTQGWLSLQGCIGHGRRAREWTEFAVGEGSAVTVDTSLSAAKSAAPNSGNQQTLARNSRRSGCSSNIVTRFLNDTVNGGSSWSYPFEVGFHASHLVAFGGLHD